jgi:hypothetical protein
MDGLEVGVFTSQPVAAVAGGRRRRRRRPDAAQSYSWHLIHDERPRTWCGIEFSYAFSRRCLWSDTPENQRCEICIAQLERVGQAQTH